MSQRAIFLDRDGVINKEKNYLYKTEDFEFVKGVFEALRFFQDRGYLIFIITNQSGIARGYYSHKDFEILTQWMLGEFHKHKISISDVQYCPHSPDANCSCRKPKTGMIDTICTNYPYIDLNNSWLIGDKDSDIQCAQNAKVGKSIQVQSGHKFDASQSRADYVYSSISDIPTDLFL